jgi:enoyl-CoA hydratase/carnithine racemase
VTTDSADSAPLLERELSGRVLQLALNRPAAANAFSAELYLTAAAAFDQAATDDDVSVVVLTGRGKAFSAGTDLKEMAQVVPEEEGQPVGGASASSEGGSGVPFNRFMEALIAFPKPLIAAVNGAGVGLGLTMLLHCDLVLVSTRARLLAPFTTMGVAPEAASSFLLPRRMGAQWAAYAFLTSEWITAQEAVDSGLAFASYEPAELLPEAMRIAEVISTKPLPSLIATKRLMREAEVDGVAKARQLEGEAFAALLRAPAMRDRVLGQLAGS